MKNDLAASDLVKMLAGMILLGVWVALVYFQVKDSAALIAFCSMGLAGLSAHYLTNYQAPPADGTTVITTKASQ